MKVICSRSLFVDAINTVQKAVGSHSTISILEGILFEASEQVKLTGYDAETGIEHTMPAEVMVPGQIVINARLLGDVVRKLPEDTVTIEVDDRQMVTIESGSSVFQLRGISALDYPKIPVVEEAKLLKVPQNKLIEMIRQTAFAASTDDSRPILNGVNVILENGRLTLVAVDGFRLAVRHEMVDALDEVVSFIVPAKAMIEVARVLPNAEGAVSIYYSHNHILFESEETRLVSRLIRGEFMNYKGLIPQSAESSLTTNTSNLLAACERATLIIEAENKRFPVTFTTLSDEKLQVSARTAIGTTEEDIEVALTGKRFDIDFNPKYFIDILKVIPDETVKVDFSGSIGPCVIRPLEGDRFNYMILPLRR